MSIQDFRFGILIGSIIHQSVAFWYIPVRCPAPRAVGEVWGIGPQTSAYLHKQGIRTALEFARKPIEWVRRRLTKPHQQIWQELHGELVFPVVSEAKSTYASIQKVRTFTPPSGDATYVFSQLSRNVENACAKARRYQLAAKGAIAFLRTQDFRHTGIEVAFSRPTNSAGEITGMLRAHFRRFFQPSTLYRMTGVVLVKLVEETCTQLDLFGATLRAERVRQVYAAVDAINQKYGKYTVFLGSSLAAVSQTDHTGARGGLPERQTNLFPGETSRRRLGIPFMGEVN